MQHLSSPVSRALLIAAILAVTLHATDRVAAQALQDEREAFKYAQRLYDDALYGTAAQEFRRFLLNFPTSERIAQARIRLADAHYQAEEWLEAVEAYQSFVDRHSDHLEVAAALRNRARALERQEEHGRAGGAFRELHNRFQAGEYAAQDLLSAGTNYDRADLVDLATAAFEELITTHNHSPLVHEASYNLGQVLLRTDRVQDALARFQSITQSEREPDALLEIGRISLNRDDVEAALQTFSDLHKRFPSSRSAERSYLVTAEWYARRGAWRRAAEIYKQARHVLPRGERRQRAVLGLADAMRNSGGDAISLYVEFLKVYPNSRYVPEAHLGLGRAFADRSRNREATEAFGLLQNSTPDHPLAHASYLDLGRVWQRVGDSRKALAAYRGGLKHARSDEQIGQLKLAIADLYRDEFEWYDLSIAELTDLTTHAVRSIAARAQFSLGLAYERAGRRSAAVREYQRYLGRFADTEQAGEAEVRLELVTELSPTLSIDERLLDLLATLAGNDAPSRLNVARYLFSHRHDSLAASIFESVAQSDSTADEAAYLAGRSYERLARKTALEGTDPSSFVARARVAYGLLLAERPHGGWADNAALRVATMDHEGADSAAISEYERLIKTYPGSDVREDIKLLMANALLALGGKANIERALATYHAILDSTKDATVTEKAAYGMGRGLAQKGAYAKAEDELRDFLFDYPGSDLAGHVRFQLGAILLERGFLLSARDEFAQLLEAPTSLALDKTGRVLLAECHYRLEAFDEAIQIDEQLLPRDPGPEVWRRLATSHRRAGNPNRALAVYIDFERRFPDHSAADSVAFERAVLQADLGRSTEAIAAFDSFLDRYPKSPLLGRATQALADLHFTQESYRRALSAYDRVPAGAVDADVRGKRVIVLYRLGRIKEAQKATKAFRKAHRGQDEWEATFSIEEGRHHLRGGRSKSARKVLQKVVKEFASTEASGDARFYLIEALRNGDDPEAHFAALVRFVRDQSGNPHWASANLELAALYSKEQDYAGASRAYLNALNNGLSKEKRPEVLEKLYKTHRNLRLYDSAVSYARALVNEFPAHPLAREAHIQIGDLLKEKGAHEEAIEELSPALKDLVGDDWSIAQNIIAESHQLKGDLDGALREYLKLVYNHQGSVNWIATALMGRARCFEALGRHREAISELEKIRARFGSSSDFGLQAGSVIARLQTAGSQ